MTTTRRPLSPLELQLAEQFANARMQAVALTIIETIELGPLHALHEELRDAFAAKYKTPLPRLPFFIKAAVTALRQVPGLLSHIDGEDVVETPAMDISVVMHGHAPVLRACDTQSIAGITAALAKLAARARAGELTSPEMQGGVLTLTCHGEDGPVFATPALNSPQSAALALFPIREQARMNLALAHDARLISAATAAAFIACFKAALAEPLHLLIGT